jgi:subtilisin family serine protease
MLKNDCSLLPHYRENIYGLSPQSSQILGWEIILFNIQSFWKKSQGENTKIAVIDTGCDYNHPDLKNNILQGINLLNKKQDPYDDHGHGTHVTGSICGENNGYGMVGIAPKSKVLPIKALDGSGNGNNINIAKGIVFAADNKCDFITMSLGSPSNSKDIYNAIKYAIKKGCVIFCAAGNSGETSPIMYPAKYDETIAIGSIDRNLNRSSFTCKGNELDFLSPGQDIVSCVPNNSYAAMSGTSMANPFAVGCASLLLSYSRQTKSLKLNNTADYISIFSQCASQLKNKKFRTKKYQGYGILRLPNI